MRITFLGSGGALCDHRVNYHNNALVQTAEGPVLLDCGTTAVQSMRELGVDRGSLQAVLLTHLHGDHASPEELLWERFYIGPGGIPPFARTKLVAPADVLDPLCRSLDPFVDEFVGASGVPAKGGLEALVERIPTRVIEIGGVRFTWFRVPHVSTADRRVDKAAYGIEIDDGTQCVVWSGDTTFAPEWITAAASRPRVGRIFHECMFMPKFRGTVHTHFEELGRLPLEIQGRITLMHHTQVPAGIELGPLAGAADRHQVFEL